ncbi:MAG: MerR family transcriptional regulator [Phascolarctobacterium sp.]|uniref:MerR family transcriptional regulator n=1 Tax=Phascolarctobacterium sp. TaxID=2049039 RepID=UPI0026DB1525|nr:MerR family transcriptional regulator [Phascolarctobacterium sp.]MDO4920674.1 MerR family transcriptional regulator [Phascolarctobacterium sp.]
MDNGYQIGEVSKITGISKDTLHFYIKSGLITPDYIDPQNHYSYFSRWNMYQLDIITTCRRLDISLEKIKQILSFRDNDKVVALLMEYQQEALRLSRYYQKVAEDIDWYERENEYIKLKSQDSSVRLEHREAEIVIVGSHTREDASYHANLQEVLKEEMRNKHFIRRTYGYFLDVERAIQNKLLKRREYVKLPDANYSGIQSKHLYRLPSGDYAVLTACIRDEETDLSPLLSWLKANGLTTDFIVAEELGFQLFKYIHQYYCEIRAHLIKNPR